MLSDRRRLFLFSFLMLFVELALIRWAGSNIPYLGYFSNFVLLASFLGIGIGFLRARARRQLFGYAPALLGLFVVLAQVAPVTVARPDPGSVIYFSTGDRALTGPPSYLVLPAVFVFVVAILTCLGEGTARTFIRLPALEAYRLDILGSLAGIGVFSLASLAGAPPVVWGIVAAALMLVLGPPKPTRIQAAGTGALVIGLLVESLASATAWSPYYKVHWETYAIAGYPVTTVWVNSIPHQEARPIALVHQINDFYLAPYAKLNRPPGRVLIIGAGTGTDVAIALDRGAESVDAVEIDPELYRLGAEIHPDHPYADPRVHVYIDDGRAFLRRTDRSYDLVLFALPDSFTLVSGQASLRLESYLFTLEAASAARARLAPHGVFAEYNYYRAVWLVDRLGNTLTLAYGHPPCVDGQGAAGHPDRGVAFLTASVDAADVTCATVWKAADPPVAPPSRDDHPFLYVRDQGIPAFYLWTLLAILLASLLCVRLAGVQLLAARPYADLGLMGAAFLLLETKNVVQFALLFGSTWLVNALVFTGILLAVLLAIEVTRRVKLPAPRYLYLLLLAAGALAWAVPPDFLLRLDSLPRFLLATSLAFAPVFLANLIFAQRFQDVGSSTLAFGANLIGAMVGGVLEYSALLIGYRNLLVVAGLLYLGAFLLAGRSSPLSSSLARSSATARAR